MERKNFSWAAQWGQKTIKWPSCPNYFGSLGPALPAGRWPGVPLADRRPGHTHRLVGVTHGRNGGPHPPTHTHTDTLYGNVCPTQCIARLVARAPLFSLPSHLPSPLSNGFHWALSLALPAACRLGIGLTAHKHSIEREHRHTLLLYIVNLLYLGELKITSNIASSALG